MKLTRVVLSAGCALAMLPAASRAQGGFAVTTLVSFNGANGASPQARLAWGADGNLYGTTRSGGQFNHGTVFRMTPAGDLATLASFHGTNGANPWAGLVQHTNGDFAFYGTTAAGGMTNATFPDGLGTVFRITTNGVLTRVVSFAGTNGAIPQSDLILGGDGSFYGTTYKGGTHWPIGYGTVFRLTPAGDLASLASFDGTNGAEPFAGLTEATDGSLCGTTRLGGPAGFGTVFKLTVGTSPIPLATFSSTDGAFPYAGLAQRSDGVFYGTTYSGGVDNLGTLFQVTADGVLTSLLAFRGTNGAGPYAALTRGGDGNFYGTTTAGGANGRGTVFQVTTNGNFATVVSFAGANGANPYASLVLGADGNLYGTTGNGGANNLGTVFRLSVTQRPPPVFQAVVQADGTLWLTWSTVSGLTYQMQYWSNLSQTNWDDLGSPVLATGVTATASYPIGPAPRRFYRVLLLP